jgi:hypothetical protein
MKVQQVPRQLHRSIGYRKLSVAERCLYLELWLVSDAKRRLPADIDWIRAATGNEMRHTRLMNALRAMLEHGLLEQDGDNWILVEHPEGAR